METYAPRLPSAPSPELDIDSASTPRVAKVGGGLVLFAGAVIALMALQALFSVEIYGLMHFAPYVLFILGTGLATLGVSIFRAAGWAPLPSTLLSILAFFLTSFWLIWTFSNGFLALFALMAPPASIVSLIMSALSVRPCQRASAARARLAAAGFGFGL
jgi:hypothetical protein